MKLTFYPMYGQNFYIKKVCQLYLGNKLIGDWGYKNNILHFDAIYEDIFSLI